MNKIPGHYKWWLLLVVVMTAGFSCNTYHESISSYYAALSGGQFEKAAHQLDKNKFLKYGRNKLLFYLEKGKTAFLQERYEESNAYFNAADSLLEQGGRNRVWDQTLGILTNPAMQEYRGEDFERFLIHFYKANNYMQLNKMEEAVVEARRISLRGYELNDRKKNKDNKYSQDVFSMIVQGIIYERAGDINNAFIAYRGAADLFLKQPDKSYYGIKLPVQLQHDLLRTAYQLGFQSELTFYEKQFGLEHLPAQPTSEREVVIFWENGLAPVKTAAHFFFTLTENGAGNFVFTDPGNTLFIPFDFNLFPKDSSHKLRQHFDVFRVAFPKYVEQPLYYTTAHVLLDSTQSIPMERVENVNQLAFRTLQERFLKEVGIGLTRLAIKKLAAYQVKKEDESLGELVNLLGILTEKADTRNWQSLPHTIYYSRIPLRKDQDKLALVLTGKYGSQTITLQVPPNGRLQTIYYSSLQKSS